MTKSTISVLPPAIGRSGTLNTRYVELSVLPETPGNGLALAQDLDQRTYLFDAKSRIHFALEAGQRLWAKVSSTGHVLKAELFSSAT